MVTSDETTPPNTTQRAFEDPGPAPRRIEGSKTELNRHKMGEEVDYMGE